MVTFLFSLIGTGIIAACAFLQNDQAIFGYATSADDDFGDVVWRIFISQATSARSPDEIEISPRDLSRISATARMHLGGISANSLRCS